MPTSKPCCICHSLIITMGAFFLENGRCYQWSNNIWTIHYLLLQNFLENFSQDSACQTQRRQYRECDHSGINTGQSPTTDRQKLCSLPVDMQAKLKAKAGQKHYSIYTSDKNLVFQHNQCINAKICRWLMIYVTKIHGFCLAGQPCTDHYVTQLLYVRPDP